MRVPMLLLVPAMLASAACSNGEGGNNAAAAVTSAPTPTGPPPRTPKTSNAPIAPGNEATWMEPRDNSGDPAQAPYGNVLSQPVVKGGAGR